ncbi:MAG: hypothetical protein ACXVHT_12475 [Methanobacterium sp.]
MSRCIPIPVKPTSENVTNFTGNICFIILRKIAMVGIEANMKLQLFY